ncbi:hypothetical protein JCM3770_005026 [Rhodotorula araucariae]
MAAPASPVAPEDELHLSMLTPVEQALIAQHTPFRFHTYPVGPSSTPATARGASLLLEPYLPLSSPAPTTTAPALALILTPPRASDLPAIVRTLNDPRVGLQLVGPPYPYTAQDAAERIASKARQTADASAQLARRARVDSEWDGRRGGWVVDGLPLCAIRRADSGEWVGDFGVDRWLFEDLPEGVERDRAIEENRAKQAGDESVLWTFGFYLNPEYHGQGIMTRVLRSVLASYLFPYLNAGEVRGAAFASNLGSVRTQEKCGFTRYMSYEREIVETRGGGRKEVALFKLRRDDFRA